MKMKIPLKLAGVIGVDRSYIKKINQGIRRPSLKTAGKIIEAMAGAISRRDRNGWFRLHEVMKEMHERS